METALVHRGRQILAHRFLNLRASNSHVTSSLCLKTLWLPFLPPVSCSFSSFISLMLPSRKILYFSELTWLDSVQFSPVTQLCQTLCVPMNCSTPGLPVHHQLLESTQTHVHRVGDAIQSSVDPFSSCPQSFPALWSFPMSQLFSSGGQSIGASASTSVLPMSIQERTIGINL